MSTVNHSLKMSDTVPNERAVVFQNAFDRLLTDQAISDFDKVVFRRTVTSGEVVSTTATAFGISEKDVEDIRSRMMTRLRKIIKETTDVEIKPAEPYLIDRGALAYSKGDVVGGWAIRKALGVGSSGEVYRVINEQSDEVAAMKVFVERPDWTASKTASARARFKREIEVLKELSFKFFPKCLDSGEHENRPFFVMEELQPFELPNTDREVARFIDDVCAAVEKLHKEKYVHRDLKPGNIMRRGDGSYVLIDLGLVKRISESGITTQPSLSIVDGRVIGVGTIGYAAPEQFNEAKASVASDIHALGMIINECFSKTSMDDKWRNIVKNATSQVAGLRYRTVTELRKAVKDRAKFVSDAVRESKEFRSKQRWGTFRKAQIVVCAIAGVIGVATAIYKVIKYFAS